MLVHDFVRKYPNVPRPFDEDERGGQKYLNRDRYQEALNKYASDKDIHGPTLWDDWFHSDFPYYKLVLDKKPPSDNELELSGWRV